MKAAVSYQELQRLVTEKTHQPIKFDFVDNKTIKVSYPINLGFMQKDLGINLRVLDILGSDLRVRYSTGFGMDNLVGMALNLVRDKIPEGVMEEQPDQVLLVHLGKIDHVQPFLDRLDVRDINMTAVAVVLEGDFKP